MIPRYSGDRGTLVLIVIDAVLVSVRHGTAVVLRDTGHRWTFIFIISYAIAISIFWWLNSWNNWHWFRYFFLLANDAIKTNAMKKMIVRGFVVNRDSILRIEIDPCLVK